jgi:GAF domain-containing protein/HAMP domain-containing protein
MTVTRRLLITTVVFFAIALLAITALGVFSFTRSLRKQVDNDLDRLQQVFQGRLDGLESFALALATEVANNPDVQAAFATGDRERLIELTHPAYLQLDEQFDIPQHQFHLPPATSFLRVHQLDRFGDDLSAFRFTVLTANNRKQPVSGPEIGRAGLGVRGVVPVAYQGTHVGTVEFGLNVDQALLETLKAQYGVDWQILLNREPAEVATFQGATGEAPGPIPELLLQATTLAQPFFADPATYQQVLDGNPVISSVNQGESHYELMSIPLRDFSGNVIGVAEAVADRTALLHEQQLTLATVIGASLLALMVGGGILAVIATHTLRPVGELTAAATDIAAGDLERTIPVPAKRQDEIGKLARALESMTQQLRSLIGSLEQQVADRTQRLETVTVISERLNAILDFDELLAEVVSQVQENFGYYHAHIYLLDEAGEKLVVAAGTGSAGADMKARGHSILLAAPRSLVARAARTAQIVSVENVREEEGWLPNPLLPETYAEMAVPITLAGQVVGVLDVQEDEIGGLDESDANLLRSLANQVAVAIRNARLFAEVETALAEAQVAQQRYAEQTWTKASTTHQGAEYYYHRPGVQALDEAVVDRLEKEVLGRSQAAVVQEVSTDQPGGDETSALMASIKIQDQMIGMIQLHDTEHPRQWSELDVALVQAIAEQVAQTAENLRLFEETRQRAGRERVIREITDKLRAAPNLNTLVNVAARELGEQLGVPHLLFELGREPESSPKPGSSGNGE